MVKIEITKNEENQRLDRFLKKYLNNSSLSYIYKLIRKDIKVNGKRGKIDLILAENDQIDIYLSDEQLVELTAVKKQMHVKKQFTVAYENAQVIIVEKPFGLLTHGDRVEKKNTLANQVLGYLQQKGDYSPGRERVFVPSPVNRLDRNTTGLVIFGKTGQALQQLNDMIRKRDYINKYYLTIVAGEMREPLFLVDKLEKNNKENLVSILPQEADGKLIKTQATPLAIGQGYSLVEVKLITGRTHQIRAHLSKAGYPVIGDHKYGRRAINDKIERKFDLNTQLLHAYKLEFTKAEGLFCDLKGKSIKADLPPLFKRIKTELFD